MELLEFKIKVLDLFKIDEVEQLPDAILSNGYSNEIFNDYLEIVDLSTDWLQHLFQYYLAERKEKMQDYTPKSLARAVSKIVNSPTSKVCLDLCAGSGSLTIELWEHNKSLSFVCKEYDKRVIPILLFNLAIRNIRAEVIHTDVLSGEVYKSYAVERGVKYGTVKEIEKQTLQADICISNPPYNMTWEPPCFAYFQNRFSTYTLPPASNANYAFILTALDEIKEKATLILPLSVLNTTQSNEADIRKTLIDNNLIESIVICPDNMFSCTSIATCILTLNISKNSASIEFVDLRNKYIEEERKQTGQYGGTSHTNRTYIKKLKVLSDEQILDVLKAIQEKRNVGDYCKCASIEDIRSNKYILSPSLYIDNEPCENKHREYADIVADINRVIKEKNACKLTINETLAKALGFDLELHKKSKIIDFSELSKIINVHFIKDNYFSATKNKNEIKFENTEKDMISSIFMLIFPMWKQHIYYLNNEENRYLAELRDALLPDLMSGKITVNLETSEKVDSI